MKIAENEENKTTNPVTPTFKQSQSFTPILRHLFCVLYVFKASEIAGSVVVRSNNPRFYPH